MISRRLVLRIASFAALIVGTSAAADPVADFYKGKEVRFVISATAGTGYDTYARAIGRHIAKYIPGNPAIVPQNMPGAGGLLAANYIYSVAPKDGTTFGMLLNTVPFEPFFDNKAARFEAGKYNWLGTPATEVGMFIVYHTSKIKTLRDAQAMEMVAGTTGTASTPALYGRLFNQLLHMKTKLVAGYPGQLELLLAMEKGEIDGMTSPFWSSLKIQRPTWVPEKLIQVLFQYGAAPHPDLKGIPFAPDLVENAADRLLLSVATAPLGFGRPIAAPPDVSAERIKALRAAMVATFKDPQFIAECEKQGIDCTDSRSGEQLEALVSEAYAAPADIRQRLVAMQRGQ